MKAVTSGDSDFEKQRTKRQHLNLLIQGAAVDEAMSHNEQQLKSIHVSMPMLNSWIGVGMQLSHLETRSYLLSGMTGGDARRFWGGISNRKHPFGGSRLLTEHSRTLVRSGHERAARKAAAVGMTRLRNQTHDRKLLDKIRELHDLEAPRRSELEALAIEQVSNRWEIPSDRLSATLRATTRPGLMFPGQERPPGFRGFLNSACSAGWSRVVFSNEPARVEAAAIVSPLLRHELVKGVCELACSHGLAQLDDAMYESVIAATDKIEYERYAMQAGYELFLKWSECVPRGMPLAAGLMYLSLAEPVALEAVLLASVEDPSACREIMGHLCQRSVIELD